MGVAIIPIAGAALKSGVASSVENAVKGAVRSIVGFVDPGKARDATRENRAELWYHWATQGSLYAARHVLGGFTSPTAQYTIKEKGYYQTRWNQLKAANATLAAQAQAAGPLGLPGDASAPPTQADIDAVTADITAVSGQVPSPYGSAPAPSTITPLAGAPAQLPAVPAPVARSGNPALAASAAAPAQQVSGKLMLMIGAGVVVLLAIVGIMGSRRK